MPTRTFSLSAWHVVRESDGAPCIITWLTRADGSLLSVKVAS